LPAHALYSNGEKHEKKAEIMENAAQHPFAAP
jgi:hypothetical protein